MPAGAVPDGGAEASPDDGDPDEPVVYVSDEPSVARRIGAVALFLLLLVMAVGGLTGYWLYGQVYPSSGTETVTVTIPPDSSMQRIAEVLEEQGVVSNATIFLYYSKLQNVGTIAAGDYDRLTRPDSMDDVLDRLVDGPLPVRSVNLTVAEGLWVSHVAGKIKATFPDMDDVELVAALQAVRSRYQPPGAPIDGFLFPDTYRVEEQDRDDEGKLLQQMVDQFDATADQIGLGDPAGQIGPAAAGLKLTPYDVLKVASLVEAEAKVPEDRPRIARVIYNRLRQGEPLGIDAALHVAIGQHRQLTGDDFKEIDSPFNLRKNKGLPPRPINSPGRASLEAALHPSGEPGADKWLFYTLIDEQGHHRFTTSNEEHERATAEAVRAGVQQP